MAREPISKKTRFEVFKRDRFTCQYCGASAPDVVLEIDHIIPVSKGGKNDVMNLVTSCKDCNRGKTNRQLSDNTVIQKQKKQLDDIQMRREQIEMMVKWREELAYESELEVDSIDSIFYRDTDWILNDHGRMIIRKLIKRFGFHEVYEATELSIERYYNGSERSWEDALNKIGGICYNRKKARENNAE